MVDLVRRAARSPMKRARLQDRGPLTEYLAFILAGDVYAAPVALVREILRPPPLTPVPRAPWAVIGIISVRGQLITVYDLRKKLRVTAAPPTRRTRFLLVESEQGETLGLCVDEVLQVYRLSDAEIEPATTALGGEVAPYIAGIARPRIATASQQVKDASEVDGRRARRGLPAKVASAPAAVSAPIVATGGPDASVIILLDIRGLLAD